MAIGGAVVGFLLTRIGRSTDKQNEHEVRISLLEQNNIRQDSAIVTTDNRAVAANARIDRLISKLRQGGEDDHVD